jgi:hypothetical protein
MLLSLCGNWLSHHVLIGAILLTSFYLCKIGLMIFRNLKNC